MMNSPFKPADDDLFSDLNPFYLEASAFPKTRPISYFDIYIEPHLNENRKKERLPNSSSNNNRESNPSYKHNNYSSKNKRQFNYELEVSTHFIYLVYFEKNKINKRINIIG